MAVHRPIFAEIDPVTRLLPTPTVEALRQVIGAPDPEMIDALVQAAVLAAQSGLEGFRFDVPTPSAFWVLDVPAGFGRVPSVAVHLISGEQVFADVMASSTRVSVHFATPTSGFAILT